MRMNLEVILGGVGHTVHCRCEPFLQFRRGFQHADVSYAFESITGRGGRGGRAADGRRGGFDGSGECAVDDSLQDAQRLLAPHSGHFRVHVEVQRHHAEEFGILGAIAAQVIQEGRAE